MKRILFTLTLLVAIGLSACKKNGAQPDIKEYDQQQIQNYITANSITGMQKDTTGKSKGQDTTGIWYQIITPGTGNPQASLCYSSALSCVFTEQSFDNIYIAADTIFDQGRGGGGRGPGAPPGGT